ncbi:MAG TPA: HDOD domain-containing protein [Pseudomonas sp.]|nr:HDOD domain-containing protein [Pseudomonas sp.]
MRVMILEDDVWIADLLKQIVLSLRPGVQVACHSQVASALHDWQESAADLLICDWNLPDGPGTRLLEQVRRDDRQVPLVLITGRADRDSVMEVRPLKINAFISKPFQVPKVLECLERLLPAASAEPASQATSAVSFLDFLHSRADTDLELPLQDGMREQLSALSQQQPSVQQLKQLWHNEPALTARLLAAANSSQYNKTATPCLSLGDALQALGATTSLNIGIGLGLHAGSQLRDAELRLQAQAQQQQIGQLHQRVAELAAACRIDPAPLHSAALLHRMGELCVLQQAQVWRDSGHELALEQLSQAMDKASSVLANRLKAHWRLPNPLRELIGACYALPTLNLRREAIIMHLAACELAATADADKLARLRRLAGLA